MKLSNPIELPLTELVPPPTLFHRVSKTHGQEHVSRVMIHAFLLLDLTGKAHHAARLWASVYVHDLARTHDGRCRRHGADAAALIDARPDLREHLARGGATRRDLSAVKAAVTWHSDSSEMPGDDPHRELTALLKDADGLDRVRLGDLDPAYLRHPETPSLIPFAERLYRETRKLAPPGPDYFEALWPAAGAIVEAMG